MGFFITKILIVIGFIGLASLIFAILKSSDTDKDSTKDKDDEWDRF